MSAWVERLSLTNFRNYASLVIEVEKGPIVLTGQNGAGKTNLLEAVSLLAPGQGLRRAAYTDLARLGGDGSWAVSARLGSVHGPLEIGTGSAGDRDAERSGRIVRIDRQTVSGTGALADHVEMVWLLPAMDGLFIGPAGDRRRFLDRLILCFDPGYRSRLGHFERAMRQRNRLLETGARSHAQFEGLELQMAEMGVAIAAARAELVEALRSVIERRRSNHAGSPFPWAEVGMDGKIEGELAERPAVDVEDAYFRTLAAGRERDRAAGRTLDGPHRSDFVVGHGPKAMPARVCSTGEQKALLVGLILAHAELISQARNSGPPILLLDEISAHLDELRRDALFDEILRLGAQVWMTGTDRMAFAGLSGRARHFSVDVGSVVEQG